MDCSRPLILLSARTTMPLLFLLPLLMAHRPINVQPRRSILRRMPYYIGKRDSSLPPWAPEYPVLSSSLAGQPDGPPYFDYHQPRPQAELDLPDLSTRYYRNFMKDMNDYPRAYSMARSGNPRRGELFKTKSGRLLDINLKPPAHRRDWDLANILLKSVQNSIRNDAEDLAFLKHLAAEDDDETVGSHSDLYRALASAAREGSRNKHGLVSFHGRRENSDDADQVLYANEMDDSYRRNSPMSHHALIRGDDDVDTDDDKSISRLIFSAVHGNRNKLSRDAFEDMLNDDEEGDVDDDEEDSDIYDDMNGDNSSREAGREDQW